MNKALISTIASAVPGYFVVSSFGGPVADASGTTASGTVASLVDISDDVRCAIASSGFSGNSVMLRVRWELVVSL